MADRDLFSMLPSDWGTYNPYQKINWFNANQVGSNELLATGAVSQGDIDWMLGQGYAGSYASPAPAPTPAPPAPTPAPIPEPIQQNNYQTLAQEEYYNPYAYQDNYGYQDLIADISTTPPPTAAPTPAPTLAPAAFTPPAQYNPKS